MEETLRILRMVEGGRLGDLGLGIGPHQQNFVDRSLEQATLPVPPSAAVTPTRPRPGRSPSRLARTQRTGLPPSMSSSLPLLPPQSLLLSVTRLLLLPARSLPCPLS